MRSTYPQIDERNYFHELNILNWIKKGTEISLEIQNVLTLDSSENCKGKNTASLEITKIQKFQGQENNLIHMFRIWPSKKIYPYHLAKYIWISSHIWIEYHLCKKKSREIRGLQELINCICDF